MASKLRAMRALRSLGEEEDEDVTSEEAEEERGDEREPGEGEGSESEGEGEEDEDAEDTDWERFFDVVTSRAGRPIYVSKLLNKRFTEASAARDFTTGKLHRRAASEARKRLLTYNEREALSAKAAQRAEKRKAKALSKAKEKAVAKRKATDISQDEIERRKAKFAAKKARRLERKADGGAGSDAPSAPSAAAPQKQGKAADSRQTPSDKSPALKKPIDLRFVPNEKQVKLDFGLVPKAKAKKSKN